MLEITSQDYCLRIIIDDTQRKILYQFLGEPPTDTKLLNLLNPYFTCDINRLAPAAQVIAKGAVAENDNASDENIGTTKATSQTGRLSLLEICVLLGKTHHIDLLLKLGHQRSHFFDLLNKSSNHNKQLFKIPMLTRALHTACQYGRLQELTLMLADTRLHGRYSTLLPQLLQTAAIYDQPIVIMALLSSHTLTPNIVSQKPFRLSTSATSSILVAIEKGHHRSLKALLTHPHLEQITLEKADSLLSELIYRITWRLKCRKNVTIENYLETAIVLLSKQSTISTKLSMRAQAIAQLAAEADQVVLIEQLFKSGVLEDGINGCAKQLLQSAKSNTRGKWQKYQPVNHTHSELLINYCRSPLADAAANGDLLTVEHLLQCDTVRAAVAADDNSALVAAATNGHLTVVDRLLEFAIVRSKIDAARNRALRNAARLGHLSVVERLLQYSTVVSSITAEDNEALESAVLSGHFAVVERLLAFPSVREAASSKNNRILAKAIAHSQVMVVILLLEYKFMQKHLATHCHHLLDQAQYSINRDIINLLLVYPNIFNYAEQSHPEYNSQIVNFIQINLQSLRLQYDASTPLPFLPDLDLKSAELYIQFIPYLIRNEIADTPEQHLADIKMLLMIPSVRQLAHQPINGDTDNALLQLALRLGNSPAAHYLLSIPTVHAIATRYNFYQEQARRNIAARELAQDEESATTLLTVGERARLSNLQKHYQHSLDEEGVDTVFAILISILEQRYQQSPIMVAGKQGENIALPLRWDNFSVMLKSNEIDGDEALKAYYQHPVHTAIRYLSKPNHWMHPHSSFVCINQETGERWSTFEEYQTLIALLWLAASDEACPPPDEITVETRINHFIQEIALIGRAHNWDKRRNKLDVNGNQTSEEYDDLEADKPSCVSGIKRRLFQSLKWHPHFDVLTREVIKVHVRMFWLSHLSSKVTSDNVLQIEKAWHAATDLDDEVGDDAPNPLQQLNVPEAERTAFLAELKQTLTDIYDDGQYDETLQAWVQKTLLPPVSKSKPFQVLGLTNGIVDFNQWLKDKKTALKGKDKIKDDEATVAPAALLDTVTKTPLYAPARNSLFINQDPDAAASAQLAAPAPAPLSTVDSSQRATMG